MGHRGYGVQIPEYTFAVSEFTTWPWTFEEDVERYRRLDVDAIEVCEFKLPSGDIRDRLALIGEYGLRMSGVQPAIRTLYPSQSQPEPRDPDERMAQFARTLARFGPYARGLPFVTNTGIPPGGNIQAVLETAARAYRSLADLAAQHEATIALEPLNASIMNVESSIWTLEQAMSIVDAVDRANFGICLDLWNVWQNDDIVNHIRSCGDRIFVVEVSDWRTPRSYQDRLVVGQGDIPLEPLLRAIHESGYRQPYALEIFSSDVPDPLWEGDLATVIRDSRAGMDRAWRAAFAQGSLEG